MRVFRSTHRNVPHSYRILTYCVNDYVISEHVVRESGDNMRTYVEEDYDGDPDSYALVSDALELSPHGIFEELL